MNALITLLKNDNFYLDPVSLAKDKETFIAIGHKGRFCNNRYTVYEISIRNIDGKLKSTYQGVIKSFTRLYKAVEFQSEIVKKRNEN